MADLETVKVLFGAGVIGIFSTFALQVIKMILAFKEKKKELPQSSPNCLLGSQNAYKVLDPLKDMASKLECMKRNLTERKDHQEVHFALCKDCNKILEKMSMTRDIRDDSNFEKLIIGIQAQNNTMDSLLKEIKKRGE